MKKTKIICTIGPACESLESVKSLIEAGMDIARLNFSHGSHKEHGKRIAVLRQTAAELGKNLGIMLDTMGPEIRTGVFKGGEAFLQEGKKVILTTENVKGDNTLIPVSYKELPQSLQKGDTVLIADGAINLEVLETKEKEITCRVVIGGVLTDRKGVNIPGVSLDLPFLTEKDIQDINFGIEQGVDFIAASFVRRPEDALIIRRILESRSANIDVIAKIENAEGVQNLDHIIKVVDGVMIARGDLGVEIPEEEVPVIQKKIIAKCNQAGKPVITATQMLESMIKNPRPTRAEASDVANAIIDGSDAIMLSGETASGKYPVGAVQVMARIAEQAENALDYGRSLQSSNSALHTRTDAIAHATCTIAADLKAAAIITATKSGFTARMVSKYRPKAPIIAACPGEDICRKLSLIWGVQAVVGCTKNSTDEIIQEAIDQSLAEGLINNGDLVILTAEIPRKTNLIMASIIGEVIAKGTGIGNSVVTGIVRICRSPEEAKKKIRQGDILVSRSTTRDYLPIMNKVGAIITEEGGLTSHAAIIGINMKIPVLVGVDSALEILEDNSTVTVDSIRGLIYNGMVSVR
ncbi:MAG TPA: pyruvate kinase [Syntrophomonadaceae bacterium]|nr:pyruvate kinase [Syntrophomonadaceae bacterium]